MSVQPWDLVEDEYLIHYQSWVRQGKVRMEITKYQKGLIYAVAVIGRAGAMVMIGVATGPHLCEAAIGAAC